MARTMSLDYLTRAYEKALKHFSAYVETVGKADKALGTVGRFAVESMQGKATAIRDAYEDEMTIQRGERKQYLQSLITDYGYHNGNKDLHDSQVIGTCWVVSRSEDVFDTDGEGYSFTQTMRMEIRDKFKNADHEFFARAIEYTFSTTQCNCLHDCCACSMVQYDVQCSNDEWAVVTVSVYSNI